MLKRFFFLYLVVVMVYATITIDWDPTSEPSFRYGATAMAAQSPDQVTVDLVFLVSDGAATDLARMRGSGSLEDLENQSSPDGEIEIGALLSILSWESVAIDRAESSTTESVSIAIEAEADSATGPNPDEYELILGSRASTSSLSSALLGRLFVSRDSPGVYSSTGYIDIDLLMQLRLEEAESPAPIESEAIVVEPMAASAGGALSSRYVVWPEIAELGETLAVVLETQSEVDQYADGALLNANVENFSVRVTDPDGYSELVPPKAVIEAPAALGSIVAGMESESWAAMIVVFDLPDPWPNTSPLYSLPADFGVAVEYEGFATYGGKTVQIQGGGGTALPALALNSLKGLELGPMLRLRPAWDPEALPDPEGFDPIWEIGGIELLLDYNKPGVGDVDNLLVRANAEANKALAMSYEVETVGDRRWKVSLVDPDGFSIHWNDCLGPGDCYSGRWSLMDLTLKKLPEELPQGSPIFQSSDFTIVDIAVTDTSGLRLNPPYQGETFFQIHAVNNLVDDPPGVGSSDYLVWPTRVRTGDTIAVLMNTELDVDLDPRRACLDAHRLTTKVQVEDPDGFQVVLDPTAAIELPAALGSVMVGATGASKTGVVLFFEIPDPWPNLNPSYPTPTNGSPVQFEILSFCEGDPSAFSVGNDIQVVGTNGGATDFAPVVALETLQLRPMLRLRPAWDPGALPDPEGFNPGWEIGGMEFKLRYSKSGDGEILSLAAGVNGEALVGSVLAVPLADEGLDKLWKISLVHPPGFLLPYKGCNGADCYSGRWALIDLLLETDENGLTIGDPVFASGEFTIEELKVVDSSGVRLNPPYLSDQKFFSFYTANNLAVPEPGTALQLTVAALGLALLGRLRRRSKGRPR